MTLIIKLARLSLVWAPLYLSPGEPGSWPSEAGPSDLSLSHSPDADVLPRPTPFAKYK